jgi:hypothetical protein
VTGSSEATIARTVPTALHTPQRCLVVYVTTVDGGNWATMGFNNAMLHSCIRWAANGVAIVHRVDGRWRFLGAGSGDIPCGRLGIPVAVRSDLILPCTMSPPTEIGAFPGDGLQRERGRAVAGSRRRVRAIQLLLEPGGTRRSGYGDTVNLQSIDHVHWAHWGAATATGQGDIVACGTGCTTVAANMTVYALARSQLAGGEAYTRLRVSFTASYPTKHTVTVTYTVKPMPEEAL